MAEKANIPKQITELTEEKLAQFGKETKLYAESLLNTQDGWKSQSPIDSTQIFTRPGITSAITILCKGILNCPSFNIKDAYTLFQLDEEAAKVIDKNSPWEVVDEFFGKYYLIYLQLLNMGPLISNRYFFLINYEDQSYKDNEMLFWGASLDAPFDFSTYGFDNKKFVRGKMPIYAWHLKAINEKQTEVRYLTETNIEGSMPSGMANSGAIKSVGQTIPNSNKYLTKNVPKNTVKFFLKKQ